MKVGNNADLTNALSHAAAAKQQAKVATPAETATRAASSVADSGVPLTLSASARADALGRSSSDFNAEKVAAVKAAIQDGSFRVNAEAVADKLLDNAYEVLAHAQQRREH